MTDAKDTKAATTGGSNHNITASTVMGMTSEPSFFKALKLAIDSNKVLEFANYAQFATVSAGGGGGGGGGMAVPAVRTIRVRGVLNEQRAVMFSTDSRSDKMKDLSANPHCELCWFFPLSKEQFRISAYATWIDSATTDSKLQAIRSQQWKELVLPTRSLFDAAPPGTVMDRNTKLGDLDKYEAQPQSPHIPSPNFVIVLVHPITCDHLTLPPSGMVDPKKVLHHDGVLKPARQQRRWKHAVAKSTPATATATATTGSGGGAAATAYEWIVTELNPLIRKMSDSKDTKSSAAAAADSKSEPTVLTNYIGGKFIPPADGKYMDDPNPATAQIIAKVPLSTKTDVDLAVVAAKAAMKEWAKTSYLVRAEFLDKIAAKLEEQKDRLAALESADTGKPLTMAKNMDIARAIANFRFFAGAIRHDFTHAHMMADALNYTTRNPLGICGLISPWNLPIYLLSWKVAPALAMGNVIIAKPSELTPLSAHALAGIIHDVGLPAGVFNLVNGLGSQAGSAICGHPDISLISFTGGTATGRVVAATAAPMFKKLSLELGGKNSTVVFADCDFDTTLDGVMRSAFTNQGQVCLCGSRLFIEEKIYDKFVTALVAKVKTDYKIGDPNTCNFGSLVSQQHREKIEKYVGMARASGGKIECGGQRPQNLPKPFDAGAFYEPTIITGLPESHACSVEEIFGPVLVVHPFKSEAEVVEAVNATPYGLAGSVWTNDLKRGHRVAGAINSGMIWLNCWLHRDLRVPFGGVKESGVGREGGRDSLEFFSDSKNICVKLA